MASSLYAPTSPLGMMGAVVVEEAVVAMMNTGTTTVNSIDRRSGRYLLGREDWDPGFVMSLFLYYTVDVRHRRKRNETTRGKACRRLRNQGSHHAHLGNWTCLSLT